MTARPTMHEQVRGLAAKGLSQTEAARELGVSRQRVSQLAAQLGLTFGPSYPPVPKARLERLAKQGLTQTDAARELGVSQKRVHTLAAKVGVSFAPVWSRPEAAVTELGRVLQAARLASGYSYSRVAALSGLHASHVRAIERGRVRRPTAKTFRALADSLAGHTSHEELVRAAQPPEQAALEQRLRRLAKQGLTRTEAARQLGVSRQGVSWFAAKLDLSFAPFRRQPKAPATELGRILQAARLASGCSYSRVAALSGLHRSHVMDLELGRVLRPTEKTLRALADGLDGPALYEELVRAVDGEAAPVRPVQIGRRVGIADSRRR